MCRLRCLVKSYWRIEGLSCLYLLGQEDQEDTATDCLHLQRRTIPKKEAAGHCETLVNLLPDYITSRSSYKNLKFLTSIFVFFSLQSLQLTNSMEQSASWGDHIFSANEKFPRFYGTRRFITVLTRAHHFSPSSAKSIDSTPTSYFFNRHFKIILPSTPTSSKLSLSLIFRPPKPCMHPSCPPFVPSPPNWYFEITAWQWWIDFTSISIDHSRSPLRT